MFRLISLSFVIFLFLVKFLWMSLVVFCTDYTMLRHTDTICMRNITRIALNLDAVHQSALGWHSDCDGMLDTRPADRHLAIPSSLQGLLTMLDDMQVLWRRSTMLDGPTRC